MEGNSVVAADRDMQWTHTGLWMDEKGLMVIVRQGSC